MSREVIKAARKRLCIAGARHYYATGEQGIAISLEITRKVSKRTGVPASILVPAYAEFFEEVTR